MFQFRRFPAYTYFIQCTLTEYCSAGFPHSEILGSKLMCSSPRLIAACHVLHRLLMPRHSPCALISLTFVEQPISKLFSFVLNKNYAGLRFWFIVVLCYPNMIPQIKTLLTSSVACLQFLQLLHCSVFKVQMFQPFSRSD